MALSSAFVILMFPGTVCFALEQLNLLNCSSYKKSPESIINSENVIYFSDVNHSQSSDSCIQCPNFFTDYTVSNFSEEVVKYISGFVALRLKKSIKCEECVGSLTGSKENLMGSFLDFKNKGGLTYPSTDLVSICTLSEKILRQHQQGTNFKLNKLRMISEVVNEFCNKYINKNFIHTPHLHPFIKSVADAFLTLRIQYTCKSQTEQKLSLRPSYTKLIHFKGQ